MSFPDYYGILKVSETATVEQIREAYKREALRTHPDRTTTIDGPDGAPLSKEEATVLFQQVADAYYVLSNAERRKEYDNARKSRSRESRNAWEESAPHHTEPDSIFGGVFEELLRPEGGYGGKTLGRIRDQKGVSVMEAFGRLEHAHKAAIIASLAAKIFHSLQ
ncbi:hypothetical protein BGX28_009737 [Mortierella sp. GBA30]|nr:hypothetical protein BGX28_009737 [Mortierella sp. GBA30]